MERKKLFGGGEGGKGYFLPPNGHWQPIKKKREEGGNDYQSHNETWLARVCYLPAGPYHADNLDKKKHHATCLSRQISILVVTPPYVCNHCRPKSRIVSLDQKKPPLAAVKTKVVACSIAVPEIGRGGKQLSVCLSSSPFHRGKSPASCRR